jgi:glycine/sarcosine N-methyltransferase
MNAYDIIAENYGDIFPLGIERVEYVESLLTRPGGFLDLGCATGDLCLEIAGTGREVHGIDTNARMIGIARSRARSQPLVRTQPRIDFRVMDMLGIGNHFGHGAFALVTCFGNTLPHLDSLARITEVFCRVRSLLAGGGRFVFQILNYDRILAENKCDFPVIEKRGFVFTRMYEFLDDKIRFTIGMETGGEKAFASSILLPITGQSALSALRAAGFEHVQCYGDYSLKPSDGGEYATLYVAEKYR